MRAIALPVEAAVRTLPEQIAASVGEAIVQGLLPPGARILEQALSDRFLVSRGPVREALRILGNEGLVVILPRRGAQVTNLTTAEVEDIFDIRASLLGLAARRVGERQDAATIAGFRAGVADLTAAIADVERYVAVTYRLSLLLADGSRNARLRGMLLSLARQTLRYTRLGLSSLDRRQQSLRLWRRLQRHLTRGEALEAEAAARSLVVESRDHAIRLLAADHTSVR